MITITLLVAGTLLGSFAQRVTGMGFALIATPAYVMAVGGWDAVTLTTLVGLVACSVLTAFMRHDVDWGRLRRMLKWAAVGTVGGGATAFVMPQRTLDLLVGLMLLLPLAISLRPMERPPLERRWHASVAGLASGFTHALAGLAGPPIIIYSRFAQWEPAGMAATAQPLFVGLAMSSLAVRTFLTGELLPSVPEGTWPLVLAGLLAGLLAGGTLSGRIPPLVLDRIVAMVGLSGCVAVVLRALTAP